MFRYNVVRQCTVLLIAAESQNTYETNTGLGSRWN